VPNDRIRRSSSRHRFHVVTIAVLALSVAATVGVTVFAHVVVAGQETRLLNERAYEVNLLLETSILPISSDLATLASAAGRGGPGAFDLAAADQLSGQQSGGSAGVALLRSAGASLVVIAADGPGLTVGQTVTGPPASAIRAALAAKAMTATGVYGTGSSRSVGFALAAPGGLVVFRQAVIGPVHPPSQAGEQAFSDVRVVVYASAEPDPGQALVATTTHIPLGGSVRDIPLKAGTTTWTTSVSPSGPLVGSVAADAQWVALVVGLVGSLLVFMVLEGMAYRRDSAEQALVDEHRFAEALQRRLLPELPTATAGLDLASAYVPGSDSQQVGGDWFDVFALESGRTAVVIGDVMGHDVDAAAAMAQLRSAVRTLAMEGGDPAWVVARLARLVDVFDIAAVVTMVYGVLEPAQADGCRVFCWANAGHLPPVLRGPEGSAAALSAGTSPLLGAPSPSARSQASQLLEPGSALVLYTDGLVEVHDENLADSIDALVRAVAAADTSSAAALCEAVLHVQLRDKLGDDVAVLVVRTDADRVLMPVGTTAGGQERLEGTRQGERAKIVGSEQRQGKQTAEQTDPQSEEFFDSGSADVVPRARHFATQALRGVPEHLVADAELVVSELVTNATLHGWPPIALSITRGGPGVRIEVEDCGHHLPMVPAQRSDAMTGRGLSLVSALSTRWGVEPAPRGKMVWAELEPDHSVTSEPTAPQVDLNAVLDAWPDLDDVSQEPRYTIRLGSVPTGLLLSAKAQIDNMVREFSLMRRAIDAGTIPQEVARLVDTITTDFEEARTAIKRQALDAAARQQARTDLELHLPLAAAAAGERYLAALDDADRYARSANLLTLATPRSHQLFRRWYITAVVDQLRTLAAGGEPAEPTPFGEILVQEIDRDASTDWPS
jgi:serine phosphatase RsbU (regulator of sigma subunit)/anti-sigma regulatory factor (Ser/Thr protein kinase)